MNKIGYTKLTASEREAKLKNALDFLRNELKDIPLPIQRRINNG
jgi:hypothetical protein